MFRPFAPSYSWTAGAAVVGGGGRDTTIHRLGHPSIYSGVIEHRLGDLIIMGLAALIVRLLPWH